MRKDIHCVGGLYAWLALYARLVGCCFALPYTSFSQKASIEIGLLKSYFIMHTVMQSSAILLSNDTTTTISFIRKPLHFHEDSHFWIFRLHTGTHSWFSGMSRELEFSFWVKTLIYM